MGQLIPTHEADFLRACTRALRGGCVVSPSPRGSEYFRVRSQSDPRVNYGVGPEGCTCPATVLCKHIAVVLLISSPLWGEGLIYPDDVPLPTPESPAETAVSPFADGVPAAV